MLRALTTESTVGTSGTGAAARRPRFFGEEHRLALERLQAKQQIIAELIHGRLPLLEATARFRAAQRRRENDPASPDEGEQLCRTVIGWAHLALSERPERADAFSEGLEQELQAHLARHGTLRLPRA